uniref:Uncharacterized protein n=2 Tax=Arundo donax TaxID=35708 RepID=A0A0A9EG59_ARUDO
MLKFKIANMYISSMTKTCNCNETHHEIVLKNFQDGEYTQERGTVIQGFSFLNTTGLPFVQDPIASYTKSHLPRLHKCPTSHEPCRGT